MIAVDIDPSLDSQIFRQEFESLNYLLKFIWNDRDSVWQFELYTPEEVLVASAPLHPYVEIFSEYRYLKTLPPGRFYVVDLRPGINEFQREDLGVNVKLFYMTSEEYDAITGT